MTKSNVKSISLEKVYNCLDIMSSCLKFNTNFKKINLKYYNVVTGYKFKFLSPKSCWL